jgi:hypothetical protein
VEITTDGSTSYDQSVMEERENIMGDTSCRAATEIPATDAARFHVLFLCVVRTIVEKYGGTMKTDPETYDAQVSIPKNNESICFDELETLFTYDELPFCGQEIL